MYVEIQKEARNPCTQNYRRRLGYHVRRNTEKGSETMYVELQKRLGNHVRRTTEEGSETMHGELQKEARKPCTQNYRRRFGYHVRRTTK